jgi:hypothetical protein
MKKTILATTLALTLTSLSAFAGSDCFTVEGIRTTSENATSADKSSEFTLRLNYNGNQGIELLHSYELAKDIKESTLELAKTAIGNETLSLCTFDRSDVGPKGRIIRVELKKKILGNNEF